MLLILSFEQEKEPAIYYIAIQLNLVGGMYQRIWSRYKFLEGEPDQ
jgi:hypothetical protein